MDETLFYVLGLSLVAVALITSFVGLRFENFPPRPVLIVGTAVFAVLVVATASFAWLNGEEEQEHRDELIASGEELSPQQGLEELGEGTGDAPPGGAPPADGDRPGEEPEPPASDETPSVDGAQVFDRRRLHGLPHAGRRRQHGTTGPVLDGALKGQDTRSSRRRSSTPTRRSPRGIRPT